VNISSIVIKPSENTLHPAVGIEADILYRQYDEAIMCVSGWLKTDDGKIVAELREIMDGTRRNPMGEIAARGTDLDSRRKDKTYKANLIAFLDEKALQHIRDMRETNEKGDVKLKLELNIKKVESKTIICAAYPRMPKDMGLEKATIPEGRYGASSGLLAKYYDPHFFTDRNDGWLLSGDAGPAFLALSEENLSQWAEISSSDWICDFAPKLGLGEYFIIEIPKGGQIFKPAWALVEKAEKAYQTWDTKSVYAHCREAGFYLNNILKDKFEKNSFIYKEKWGKAYAHFESTASLDLHLEDIKESASDYIPIEKNDTEHLLIITKALIKYAEELYMTNTT